MNKLLEQVKDVNIAVLRGCKDYNHLLNTLINNKVPKDSLEKFVEYMIYNFYTNEDYFAILSLIKTNLSSFEGYEAENIVFRDILNNMLNDYIELAGE